MIRLPYSKTKRYLTGSDWIIHTIDYLTKDHTGCGNMSQIVLELDGVIEEAIIRQRLNEFVKKFPVACGRLARDYNLAPYWKIYSKDDTLPLKFRVYHLDAAATLDNVLSCLGEGLNLPFSSIREHIAFHIVYCQEKCFLAMMFDHCLLDARGAEVFLSIFQEEQEAGGDCAQRISLTEPAGLCRWQEKFRAGQHVNRMFLHLAENAPPRVLPLPSSRERRKFYFKVIPFNAGETLQFIETAYTEAGYLLLMPYMLALTLQGMHRIFNERGINSGDYVIPVSCDPRLLPEVRQEVFFNHVSFFMFRFSVDETEDFSTLIKSVKNQMYEQVKSGLSKNIDEASSLMRIVPLRFLSPLMLKPLKGQIASFCFSYVGESAYAYPRFLDRKINNIFHMPRVSVPPGIGIFFTQFQGKLNIVISYLQDMLSEDELNAITHALKSYDRVPHG